VQQKNRNNNGIKFICNPTATEPPYPPGTGVFDPACGFCGESPPNTPKLCYPDAVSLPPTPTLMGTYDCVDFTGGFTSCSIDTDISSTCFDQFGTLIFSDFFSDCAIGERPVGAPLVVVENGRDIS
jgi:hypothetical protein